MDSYIIECPRCGRFRISGTLLFSNDNDMVKNRSRISGFLRLKNEEKTYDFFLNSYSLENILKDIAIPIISDLKLKAWYLTQAILRRTSSFGSSVDLNVVTDISLAFSENTEELSSLIEYIKDAGYLDIMPGTFSEFTVKLTSDGYLEKGDKFLSDKGIEKNRSSNEVALNAFIRPENQFSNIVAMKKVINECKGSLVWVDKYLTLKTLEILMETINENPDRDFSDIKLLGSIDKIDKSVRDRFIRFNKELSTKNIQSQMKIMDTKIAASIHDRWIIGENKIYNIPSADTIAQGQYSEITETKNRLPVEKLWEASLDVVSDWNKIEKLQNEKIKNKGSFLEPNGK